MLTGTCNVDGGGTLFQGQAPEKDEFDSAISESGTEEMNQDGTLKQQLP